jgi:predicted aspartyl protease
MGKTMQKIKIWNFLDEEKIKRGEVLPIEVEAQVDNGATSVVLPKDIAERLNLPVARKTWVKYANEKRERKDVVRGLVIELLGRSTICEAIVEPERNTALVGQFVLEMLDLWIDSKNGELIPNPESPDMPLLDEI